MKYIALLGIEHLMTGVTVESEGGKMVFDRETPSVVRITSDAPIKVFWPLEQSELKVTEAKVKGSGAKYTEDEARWYKDVVGRELSAMELIRPAARKRFMDHWPKAWPAPPLSKVLPMRSLW